MALRPGIVDIGDQRIRFTPGEIRSRSVEITLQ